MRKNVFEPCTTVAAVLVLVLLLCGVSFPASSSYEPVTSWGGLYHKDTNYLTALLNVPILGYVEPLPGIPPTAAHLQELVRSLSGKKGVILYNTFQSGDAPGFLARNLGWKMQQLQLECGLDATGPGYLDHVDRWVSAVAAGKP